MEFTARWTHTYVPRDGGAAWLLRTAGTVVFVLVFKSCALDVVGFGCGLQRPHPASPEELTAFHSDDYVDFLRRVTPDNIKTYTQAMSKCTWWFWFFFEGGLRGTLLTLSSL